MPTLDPDRLLTYFFLSCFVSVVSIAFVIIVPGIKPTAVSTVLALVTGGLTSGLVIWRVQAHLVGAVYYSPRSVFQRKGITIAVAVMVTLLYAYVLRPMVPHTIILNYFELPLAVGICLGFLGVIWWLHLYEAKHGHVKIEKRSS